MTKEIFGFSVRRSGHSAIMNWIAGHSEPAIWLNDIFWRTNGNYGVGAEIRLKKDEPAVTIKEVTKKPVEQYIKEEYCKYKLHIVGFEDHQINPFTLEWMGEMINRFRTVDDPNELRVVFIRRNEKDLYESQRLFGNNQIPEEDRIRSKKIQEESLRIYNNDLLFPYKIVHINYDLWCVDEKYRRSISKKLGFKFNDSRRYEVLSYSSYGFNPKDSKQIIAERLK